MRIISGIGVALRGDGVAEVTTSESELARMRKPLDPEFVEGEGERIVEELSAADSSIPSPLNLFFSSESGLATRGFTMPVVPVLLT